VDNWSRLCISGAQTVDTLWTGMRVTRNPLGPDRPRSGAVPHRRHHNPALVALGNHAGQGPHSSGATSSTNDLSWPPPLTLPGIHRIDMVADQQRRPQCTSLPAALPPRPLISPRWRGSKLTVVAGQRPAVSSTVALATSRSTERRGDPKPKDSQTAVVVGRG
jgi:hypothetical protein